MGKALKLLLLAEGDPETRDSWSGSSRALVLALRDRGVEVTGGDVDLYGVVRAAWGAAAWAPDRRRWIARYHCGGAGFALRSLRARSMLTSSFDAVLQIGASFNGLRYTDLPGFVYCDSNASLSARHAFGDVGALTERQREAVINRERGVYGRARTLFTMSEYLRRSFVEDFGIAENRVETVYAGANLDLRLFDRPPAPRSGPPTILFVGRQWERKGGPILVEAFSVVQRAIRDARLCIVGCRPPMADRPGIEVVGPVNKDSPNGEARLSALYERADLFCMPSRYEPFGVTFVEAMLRGLPCIGTDRCAMPEIIANYDTGWIVPSDDIEALARRLIAALANRGELAAMGRRGRERALGLFTWAGVAERIVNRISDSLKTSVASTSSRMTR